MSTTQAQLSPVAFAATVSDSVDTSVSVSSAPAAPAPVRPFLAADLSVATPKYSAAPSLAAPTALPGLSWINLPIHEETTFSTTCIHPSNRLPLGMIRKVCQNTATLTASTSKESLMAFLHGGCSLGKTHMLHLAANELISLCGYRQEELAFFSAASFSSQVQSAYQAGQLDRLLNSIASAKGLLFDDVHGLSGNELAQEALLSLFDSFENAMKPRFFTSLFTPDTLSHFSLRLTKRFQWGMLIELEKIDRSKRAAIIHQRSSALNIQLPDTIVQYLGNLDLDTIRDVDAILIKLTSVASIMNQNINIDFIRRITQPIHPEIRRTITMSDIEVFIRERFNIDHEDMISPKRSRNIAFPRQIAMYLTHEFTHTSMEAIGNFYGGRDHSTVKHACEKIRDCQHSDPVVKSVLERFQQTFC